MPTCNYDIGDIAVTKDGSIICPDDSSIIAALSEAGFTEEEADTIGLTVSLPAGGFTETAISNLHKLVDAKAALIRKALGADRLNIVVEDEKVSFPWWDSAPEPDEIQAYTAFLAALCEMAKDAKRVIATEKPVESEKYAFRCFLLRLDFIGSETKTARKILLRRLSGHSAFRNKAEEERWKENRKAKRETVKNED